MSKPQRAVRSASETQLRKNITAPLKSKGRGKKLITAATLAKASRVLDGDRKDKNKEKEPIKVSSVRIDRPKAAKGSTKPSPSSKSRTAQPVTERDGRKKTPAALPGVSKPAKTRSKGSKEEKTPGMKRVFKATPVVDLREGPDFGKVTNQIEETFQPKTPKAKKNAS